MGGWVQWFDVDEEGRAIWPPPNVRDARPGLDLPFATVSDQAWEAQYGSVPVCPPFSVRGGAHQ